jgi:hypothetical protein
MLADDGYGGAYYIQSYKADQGRIVLCWQRLSLHHHSQAQVIMSPILLPGKRGQKLYVPCELSEGNRNMVLKEQNLSLWYRDID